MLILSQKKWMINLSIFCISVYSLEKIKIFFTSNLKQRNGNICFIHRERDQHVFLQSLLWYTYLQMDRYQTRPAVGLDQGLACFWEGLVEEGDFSSVLGGGQELEIWALLLGVMGISVQMGHSQINCLVSESTNIDFIQNKCRNIHVYIRNGFVF